MFVLQMHQQKQSPLFKLPSELRNSIYELVFGSWVGCVHMNVAFSLDTPEALEASPLALGPLTPPSDPLVRSCQNIRKESKNIFDAAFRAYWKNEFVINICQHQDYQPYANISANIPNKFLARIQNFTFLVRHRSTRIKVACLWSESESRWTVNAEHDGSSLDDDDEVAHAAVEDVEDSMRRSEAFTTTSPATMRASEGTQTQRSALDRRILHDVLRPLIVEEMFFFAAS